MFQTRLDNVDNISSEHRRLDALAELIEVFSGSTCIALYVDRKNQIVIASNDLDENSKGQGSKKTTAQEDRILDVYQYFKNIANTGTVPKDREVFFNKICKNAKFLASAPSYYQSLGDARSNALIREIIKSYPNIRESVILSRAYQQGGTEAAACGSWLNLYSSFMKLEKELQGCKLGLILENTFNESDLNSYHVPTIVKLSEDKKFKLIFLDQNGTKHVKEVEDADGTLNNLFQQKNISSDQEIFLPWEDPVITKIIQDGYTKKSNRKIASNYLDAFKKDPVILKKENKKDVHAETQIVAELLRIDDTPVVQQQSSGQTAQKESYYIGIGKLCCLDCHIFLEEAKKSSKYSFSSRGHHDIKTAWQTPYCPQNAKFLKHTIVNADKRVRSILEYNGYFPCLIEKGQTILEAGKIYFNEAINNGQLEYKVVDPTGETREGKIDVKRIGLSDAVSNVSLDEIKKYFLQILEITSAAQHTRKANYGSVMEHNASDHGSMHSPSSNPISPALNQSESVVDLIVQKSASIAFDKINEVDISNTGVSNPNTMFIILLHLSKNDKFLSLRSYPVDEGEDIAPTFFGIIEDLKKQKIKIKKNEDILKILTNETLVGKNVASSFGHFKLEVNVEMSQSSDDEDPQRQIQKKQKISQYPHAMTTSTISSSHDDQGQLHNHEWNMAMFQTHTQKDQQTLETQQLEKLKAQLKKLCEEATNNLSGIDKLKWSESQTGLNQLLDEVEQADKNKSTTEQKKELETLVGKLSAALNEAKNKETKVFR